MSRLHGIIITNNGIAANNRGENEGNITSLQKILWNNEVHTTVSAEAIRWAIRYYWQCVGLAVNRVWNEEKEDHRWQDPSWSAWNGEAGEVYIDDDVLGFMLAEAASQDGDEESEKDKKKGKKKGTCNKRRGVLEISRALSLTPYNGEVTFNSKSGEKNNTSLYGTEVHATRYQYGFSFTPNFLRLPQHADDVVDALISLSNVAGNHARFLFDFSPDTVVFRWTNDFSPRMLYGFSLDEQETPSIETILEKIKNGDILAEELVIGGSVINTLTSEQKSLLKGATLCSGVKEAGEKIKEKMKQ